MEGTLICTVYNEADTIEELLDSMQEQRREPDEIVIVDGGSDDGTWEILQEYEDEMANLRLLQEDGCNIAEGRNIAVQEASNDHIVGTDGGCVLDEHWFEEMMAAFEDGAEYVIGMFRPLYDNIFEKVQGEIICSPHTVEELEKGNRGPSSRSVGFTRQAWEDAGGYPEDLYTGEDSKFNAQMMAAGYEPAVAEDAVVYWRMRPSWRDLYDQFATYGEGDAKGGNLFTHPSEKLGVTKNLLLFGNGMLVTLLLLATLYDAIYNPVRAVPMLLLTLGVTAIPTMYYWPTLLDIVHDDGFQAFGTGVLITQVKAWAWCLGFTSELLRNPSLAVKQVREAVRLRG